MGSFAGVSFGKENFETVVDSLSQVDKNTLNIQENIQPIKKNYKTVIVLAAASMILLFLITKQK